VLYDLQWKLILQIITEVTQFVILNKRSGVKWRIRAFCNQRMDPSLSSGWQKKCFA